MEKRLPKFPDLCKKLESTEQQKLAIQFQSLLRKTMAEKNLSPVWQFCEWGKCVPCECCLVWWYKPQDKVSINTAKLWSLISNKHQCPAGLTWSNCMPITHVPGDWWTCGHNSAFFLQQLIHYVPLVLSSTVLLSNTKHFAVSSFMCQTPGRVTILVPREPMSTKPSSLPNYGAANNILNSTMSHKARYLQL